MFLRIYQITPSHTPEKSSLNTTVYAMTNTGLFKMMERYIDGMYCNVFTK
jgi:hypothetical protein